RLAGAAVGDEPLEDLARPVTRVTRLGEARGERVSHGLETELVDDGQRALGQSAAEAHAVVEVLTRGVLLLEHRGGMVQVREDEGVGERARFRHVWECSSRVYPVVEPGGVTVCTGDPRDTAAG